MTTHESLTLPQMHSATIRLPQHVVFRAFPAETVVLNLDSGKYHSLNPVAGRMLEVLGAAKTFGDGLRQLQNEFKDADPGRVEGDLYQFCVSLADRGLIEVKGA